MASRCTADERRLKFQRFIGMEGGRSNVEVV